MNQSFPKPKDGKPPKRLKPRRTMRKKTRNRNGMVRDLDKWAQREIRDGRDQAICQRCGAKSGDWDSELQRYVVIQWCHVQSREYHLTRWEPDNSFAGCDRCHVWFDNHKVLGFDWFAKKFPERWERINRIMQMKLLTDGNCQMKDANIRELWLERLGGEVNNG